MGEASLRDRFVFEDASGVLGQGGLGEVDWRVLGAGMRTRAVLTPAEHVTHRFGTGSSVVVKLYKGRGNPKAGAAFRVFHGETFGRLPGSVRALPLQRSIEAGMHAGMVPYAVLGFVRGRLLREILEGDGPLALDEARQLLTDLLLEIWVPLWAHGLRFKDCHPGNFVVRPDGRLTMIDVEQMRKGAVELLETPERWDARDKHEASGLRRLPGLLERFAGAVGLCQTVAARRRFVRRCLEGSGLVARLKGLGRQGATEAVLTGARDASRRLVDEVLRPCLTIVPSPGGPMMSISSSAVLNGSTDPPALTSSISTPSNSPELGSNCQTGPGQGGVMVVFADGFLPLHVELNVADGQVAAVKDAVAGLKSRVRGDGFGDRASLLDCLRAVPGVQDVCIEGPQSSLLIPLRMVRSLASASVVMSAVVGDGWMARSILDALDGWGVGTALVSLEGSDSPVELSIRDGRGQNASVKLYPSRRGNYRQRALRPEVLPGGLLVNRANKGLLALGHRVSSEGGWVSFRVRKQGRYDSAEDLDAMLAVADHVCISVRSGAMRQVARHLGLTVPRGWPGSGVDERWGELARRLGQCGERRKLVVLVTADSRRALFWTTGGQPIVVCVSGDGYGTASRMARLQGVCAADAVLRIGRGGEACPDVSEVAQGAQRWLELAFEGTDVRPWLCPSSW
mgnify:CR=1 FL=1